MTAPKKRGTGVDRPLTRRERALLTYLAHEIESRATLPSNHAVPRVRVVIDHEADFVGELCALLRRIGAPTAGDQRGAAFRLGKQYIAGGMTPKEAAVAALEDTLYPFPQPRRAIHPDAIKTLAAELARKRPRVA